MDFFTIASQMLSLFFIMAVGYIMYKVHVIDDAATVRYTRLVMNIALPAQIITSFIDSRGVVSNREVVEVFGVSIFCCIIYALVAAVFMVALRVPKEEKGMYWYMSLFSNVGFMGFPVITTIFGEGALIYAVIFNVVFNVLVYSVGIMLVSGGKEDYQFNPKLLLNIPFISSILSVLLFFIGIKLPAPLRTSLGYMGNIMTPVAMLILGATIAAMPMRELFGDWRVYVFTVFRLAVIPLTVLAVLRGLHLSTPLVRGVMIILAAMPVATNATMLAIQYDGDRQLASKGIFFSTILSVITIPIITMFC